MAFTSREITIGDIVNHHNSCGNLTHHLRQCMHSKYHKKVKKCSDVYDQARGQPADLRQERKRRKSSL